MIQLDRNFIMSYQKLVHIAEISSIFLSNIFDEALNEHAPAQKSA